MPRKTGSDLTDQIRPLCETLAEKYFTDRYPGFDLEDPDWPVLRTQIDDVSRLLATVKQRVSSDATSSSRDTR